MHCKYCNKDFSGLTGYEKANHTRWCELNPKRNNWNKTQGTINRYGDIKEYEVCCDICQKTFIVKEREKVHPAKDKYYCSKQCANAVGGRAKSKKYYPDELASYITVAWRYHERRCLVCDEVNVVAVHHLNENHDDNRPENLVPLCPTHHHYMHSKHKPLIENKVLEYVKEKWGQ